MDIVTILSFVAVAAILVISPGPNGLLIAKTVATSGKSAGFANITGFVAAFLVHGSLSIFGISVLLVQSAQAFLVFKLLGAAYLCWIGIKALISACKSNNFKQGNLVISTKITTWNTAVFEGFLTNALNPKVSMFYLAAFPQFLPLGGEIFAAASLVFIHAFINVIWFSVIVLLLSNAKHITISDNINRGFKAFTGIVFIGFAAKLVLLKPAQSN